MGSCSLSALLTVRHPPPSISNAYTARWSRRILGKMYPSQDVLECFISEEIRDFLKQLYPNNFKLGRACLNFFDHKCPNWLARRSEYIFDVEQLAEFDARVNLGILWQ